MSEIKEWIRHNRMLLVATLIAIGVGIYIFGCQPSVASPFTGQSVTRAELDAEVEAYIAKLNIAYGDLAKKEAFVAKLTEIGVVLAQGGTVNPAGAALGLIGIMGIGAVANTSKKDSLIKSLQNTIKQQI